MKKKLSFLFVTVWFLNAYSQTTFPNNGAPYKPHTLFAFINAQLVIDYEITVNNGVLLVKDGKIIASGNNVSIPKHAVTIDLKGKFIYPSFIDIYSDYGLNEIKASRSTGNGPQTISNVKGAFGWNQAIRADVEAHKIFQHNKEKAQELIRNGIGVVLSSSKDGIVRGSGVLALLNHDVKENESVLMDKSAAFYSFNKGSSGQDYPSSLTGAIALIRQTYYDAIWYKTNNAKTEFNISLEAFNQLQSLPSIFEANDKFNAIRAAKIAKEFNTKYIIKAGGNEYQRLEEIAQTGSSFILPLNFPEPYDVDDPFETESISLADLKHWELAPANPAYLEKNNINFCFTSYDLKDKSSFLPNIRKAVKHGLSEKMALKAITANPALLINAYTKIGALKPGFTANFLITNKSIFDDECEILQHWINGNTYLYKELDPIDLAGNYQISFDSKNYQLQLRTSKSKNLIIIDTLKKSFNYNLNGQLMQFSFKIDSLTGFRGLGNYNADSKTVFGKIQNSQGVYSEFKIQFIEKAPEEKKPVSQLKQIPLDPGKIIYPFMAYGSAIETPVNSTLSVNYLLKKRENTYLFKNATVWTNEHDSVLRNTDVLVLAGKISKIGKNIELPKGTQARVIDATGKHLTPGIIDEHSHIALTWGVNEGTQASSAEVRMGDVINPEDVNIYRQLAGGVTCAQLLHGSANPIGGQSAIIKLRWGLNAEDMKVDKADGFIKFALGENVKQSWVADYANMRFPQTRMGVEQVYNDYFTRAKEYDANWKNVLVSKEKNKLLPRRDLELEALAEILNKKRFISCHSYVQSEINMLMHVADSFGFKVNTFTHILEGYKVADKMKNHGVNASTFADWWAYKNEVMDAIPYNAALLTKVGVNTSVNSDDAEMARRLNQEAAKAIKYGNLTEVEALKLVTLNPAKMLHLDSEVGSVKVGKSADLVLWNNHPLSVYAKSDMTLIDGIAYFDRVENQKLNNYIKSERARIVSKLLNAKQSGAKTQKFTSKEQRLYHCNTLNGVSEEITGER
jgi:imidazolonepropionase-like amidohydrolase